MGKQGTLHPRKHPCSSAGVVPEHIQTDRFRQTHTETHTPNGCFPSLKAPTSCSSTPLPLRAQSQSETEAIPPTSPSLQKG